MYLRYAFIAVFQTAFVVVDPSTVNATRICELAEDCLDC